MRRPQEASSPLSVTNMTPPTAGDNATGGAGDLQELDDVTFEGIVVTAGDGTTKEPTSPLRSNEGTTTQCS